MFIAPTPALGKKNESVAVPQWCAIGEPNHFVTLLGTMVRIFTAFSPRECLLASVAGHPISSPSDRRLPTPARKSFQEVVAFFLLGGRFKPPSQMLGQKRFLRRAAFHCIFGSVSGHAI